MKKKNLLKAIAFICIFVLIFNYISNVFKAKWLKGCSVTYMSEGMYELEDNSIDVCILGSSQMVYGLSAPRMLDKYGISAYGTGTDSQPMLCTYFYLKELNKTQDFSTAILDVSMLYEQEEDARFRKTIDNVPFSKNKLDLIWEYTKGSDLQEKWENIFSIFQYHSRWNELEQEDFDYKNMESVMFMGTVLRAEIRNDIIYEDIITDGDEIDSELTMNEGNRKYFGWVVDYCKENDINLVLIKTPKRSWNRTKQLGVAELAEEYGLDYLDFNSEELIEAIGLDITKDFADPDHLNIRGTTKLTDYMCEYLLERYEYRDAREAGKYNKAELEKFKKDYENKWLRTETDVVEFLKLLQGSDYEIALQTSGDISAGFTDEIASAFANIGIDVSKIKDNYVAYVKDDKCEYEESSKEPIEYIGKFSDGRSFKLLSDVADVENAPKTYVAGSKTTYANRGINMIIYRADYGNTVKCTTIYLDGTGTIRIR